MGKADQSGEESEEIPIILKKESEENINTAITKQANDFNIKLEVPDVPEMEMPSPNNDIEPASIHANDSDVSTYDDLNELFQDEHPSIDHNEQIQIDVPEPSPELELHSSADQSIQPTK